MASIVRPIQDSDHDSWRTLWRAYLEFYKTDLSDEIYQSTWRRLLGDDYYDARGLIAEQNGEAVGLAHYFFQRHGWRVDNVTYLQDLYVKPETRGTGVGRALIEAVYAAADEAGCASVYWLTEDHNGVARRLYDHVGTLTRFIKYQR